MTLVSPTVPSPGDEANATDISVPVNQLATVINGALDDTNISGLSGSKIAAGTLDTIQLADGSVTNAKLDDTAGMSGGARASHTPTITSEGGTITTSSGTTKYTRIGKNVIFTTTITITTVGTGTGACFFTLPVTALTTSGSIGSGRETALSGHALTVRLSSATVGAISKYDNTSPLATGSSIIIHGHYEAA